jgi:hypothetical protein
METQTTDFGKFQKAAFVLGLIGLIASAYGYKTSHEQFASSYLLAFVFWLALAGGSLALLMIHHLVSGRWGFVIQRPVEAAARTMPLFALLFIPVVLCMHELYEWTHLEVVANDRVLSGKAGYLNEKFFLMRAAVYFVVWTVLAYTLSCWSNKLDHTEDAETVKKIRALSAIGIVAFAITMTFASFDWVMSLEPHWFSSIYGALFMVGQGLATFAFMSMMAAYMGKREPLHGVITPRQYHDVGNMMFAFTILWTYMSFSQFVIIWSGNLPEETFWYLDRGGPGWLPVSFILAAFNFVLPFVFMLIANNKRNPDRLKKIAFWVFTVRAIDYYWQIGPTFRDSALDLHWLDAATFVGVGGLWLAVFFTLLKRRPLLIKHDPRFSAFAAGGQSGHH